MSLIATRGMFQTRWHEMKTLFNLIVFGLFCITTSLAKPPLKQTLNEYDCIYTAVLELGEMGRYFGVDMIIKGMASQNNTGLLSKFADSKRLPLGQKAVVFTQKSDRHKCLIVFIDKTGNFRLTIDSKRYTYNLNELMDRSHTDEHR
jgi:hypothetical protein